MIQNRHQRLERLSQKRQSYRLDSQTVRRCSVADQILPSPGRYQTHHYHSVCFQMHHQSVLKVYRINHRHRRPRCCQTRRLQSLRLLKSSQTRHVKSSFYRMQSPQLLVWRQTHLHQVLLLLTRHQTSLQY